MNGMILYLYGADSYRRNRKLREILDAYARKHKALDLRSADFEDNPEAWRSVRDFLSQPSLFVDSKVAVIRESGTVEEKEWVATLKGELKTEKTFVLISDREKPKKVFSFLMKAPVQSQAFHELEGAALSSWVEREAKARGLVFSRDALLFFLRYLEAHEGRSARVVHELDRVALLQFPQPITFSDLRAAVRWYGKDEVSELAREMLRSRTAAERLFALEKAFLGKASMSYLFNSLAFQAQGRALPPLAACDVAVKSGMLDYEEALLDFALSV